MCGQGLLHMQRDINIVLGKNCKYKIVRLHLAVTDTPAADCDRFTAAWIDIPLAARLPKIALSIYPYYIQTNREMPKTLINFKINYG